MRCHITLFVAGFLFILFAATQNVAGQSSREEKPMNSSKIAQDGTAYVTRVVPVPTTISPEAQQMLARLESDAAVSQTLGHRRTGTAQGQAGAGEQFKTCFPVKMALD